MSVLGALRGWNSPRADGDQRHRLLRHHLPLAIVSALALAVFMNVATFEADQYPPPDIFSSSVPKEYGDGGAAQTQGAGGAAAQGGGRHEIPAGVEPDHEIPQERLEQLQQLGVVDASTGGGSAGGSDHTFLGLSARQFTFASGYLATGLLGLTLLVGPANLLLRRRNPVSNYLSRDAGMWAAVASVVHVLFGLEVHAGITDPWRMFVLDGEPLTNSFGLANWTGLAATVIAIGLLAISNNYSLRKLKAKRWKNVQRLNYALFALVAAHAFFYGALLRIESPYTVVLFVSVTAVMVGQLSGVWLWRRRHSRPASGEPAFAGGGSE